MLVTKTKYTKLDPVRERACEEGRQAVAAVAAVAKDRSIMTASASMEACLSMFFFTFSLLKCPQESQATVRVPTAIYVNVSKALYVNSCPLIDSPLLLRLLGLLVEHGRLSNRGRGEHGRSGNMHAIIGNHAAGLGGVGEVLVERIPTVPLAKVGPPPEAGAYPNADDGDDDDDEEDDPLVVVVHPGRCIVSYVAGSRNVGAAVCTVTGTSIKVEMEKRIGRNRNIPCASAALSLTGDSSTCRRCCCTSRSGLAVACVPCLFDIMSVIHTVC